MGQSILDTWLGVGQSFLDNYTYYYNLNFIINLGSSYEARIETPVREAGVLSNFAVYVTSYTGSGTCTVTVRKSRADTSMTVSYATAQWGYKEDTTNTATFANTDELSVKVVVPGEAGSRYLYILHSHAVFTPTDTGKTITFLGSCYSSFSVASTTRYIGVNGIASPVTTEENEKTNIAGTFTWKNFYVHCGANSRTNNTVFKSRKNGADGSQTVTFGNLETGTKEDTSNTDSLADGDDINYSITTGTGTESIEINVVASILSSTSSEWMWSTCGYGGSVAYNKTFYDGLNGYATSQDTTESNIRMLPRFDFSTKKLAAYSPSNTVNGTSTLTLRDNGADSAIAVSWGSSESGWKYDSSDVVAFTSGTDYIVYKLATGGTTGSFTFWRVSMLGYVAGAPPATVVPQIQFMRNMEVVA